MTIEQRLKDHHYGVKSFGLKVHDIDEGTRKVKFYAASFNTLDSDRDVIRPGAFLKSINEHGPGSMGNRKIAHLRNHSWEDQIGLPVEMKEDGAGLLVVSQLGRSTKGQDALLDYQDGILREHSIGFNYIADRMKFIKESELHKDGHYDVNEVKLWEVSGVTFGANSLTPVVDVAKGEVEQDIILKKLNDLSERFFTALKNGKGTDQRLENLEAQFKQIQQLQVSLSQAKPVFKTTSHDDLPKTNAYYNSLITHLKTS